jgi:hypothetical protein
MSECKIESDGEDLFVVYDGVRIAKRGRPGTPQAGTWVSLKPGWSVTSSLDPSKVIVMQDGVWRH